MQLIFSLLEGPARAQVLPTFDITPAFANSHSAMKIASSLEFTELITDTLISTIHIKTIIGHLSNIDAFLILIFINISIDINFSHIFIKLLVVNIINDTLILLQKASLKYVIRL